MKLCTALIGLCALGAALFSSGVQAYTCTAANGVIGPGGSQTPVDVRVRVGPVLKKGKNEIINIQQVTCRSDVYDITDFLHTGPDALALNSTFFTGITTGLTVSGVDYNSPVPAGIHVQTLTHLASGQIPLKMYIVVRPFPTPNISIKQGDVVATINFAQTNDRPDCPIKCGPYKWRLIADNDANFVTTSCTINSGQQIDVDFGDIRQDKLTVTATSATIKQNKALTYDCEDTTATQDILIRLVSDTASFSSDLIATTNSDVGVALTYNGKVIKPNEGFKSRIINGKGSDTISFIPVKSSTKFKNITTGPLTGSATLIFSAP